MHKVKLGDRKRIENANKINILNLMCAFILHIFSYKYLFTQKPFKRQKPSSILFQ